MKTQDMQKWNKKLAGFMAVIGASALIYLPTMAQAGSRNNETSQNRPTSSQPSQEGTSASGEMTSESDTIVAIASANDNFKTLTKALQAAELTETLSGNGPFTVFAPTDAAFAALPQETLQKLLLPENKALLTKILTYHVVPGKVLSSDLKTGEVKTVEGSPVRVRVDTGKKQVMVNNARVTQADIQASNGVIHVIDKIIVPPELQSRLR
ncbi:fasciclin domain-containing protein [Aerosakkonema funiforme]|uniref:fasciclin domain-containing protein n=1 Tax=Aerosakkonema funiforme TaxID=1246630 RepID=UPI0035B9E995